MQIPPKRILVPVDFSDAAFEAWGLARELARGAGARVEAAYVYETSAFQEPLAPFLPLTEEASDKLAAALSRRLGGGADVFILEGLAAVSILGFAQRRKADMIVMGTRGRTGLPRVLLGSTAETLSRHSPVPVLTVREKWRPIGSILVPLNFTPYSLKGFLAAADLAQALGARLDSVFVADGPFSKKLLDAAFRAALDKLPPSFANKRPTLELRRGDPAKEILTAARGHDLIALVAHRKNFLGDLILGTTAERVLRHSRVPVLSLPLSSSPPKEV